MAFLPQLTGDDLEWIERVACADVDPARFFVSTGHSLGDEELALCRSCPVRRECVERAYELNIRPGYFGGLSPSFRENHTLAETLEFLTTDTGETPIPT
jgi:WhiB family transcriptional regulator, redox-sensing transcriptional regulator